MEFRPPRKTPQGKGTVIANLGRAEVSKGDPVVWPGFRIFEAVPDGSEASLSRARRKLNAINNPPFDPSIDTLFDYPTICSYKAGTTEWRKYNRLCAVHIDRCPFECWHCYNDAWQDKEAGIEIGHPSADDIAARFFEQRDFDKTRGKHTNILRITGGEPFCEAGLIARLCELIKDDNSKRQGLAPAVVWTETNLVPFIDGSPCPVIGQDQVLTSLASNDFVAVHPCLHGLSDGELRVVTGYNCSFNALLNAFASLVEKHVDIYPTIHSNLCDPAGLSSLFANLQQIHPNLPLRFALVEVDLTYAAVRKRMTKYKDRAAYVHLGSRHAALYEWDRLIREHYGFGYAVMPRHLVSLDSTGSLLTANVKTDTKEKQPGINVSERRLLLLKGSQRGTYRQEVLTSLGLPDGFIFKVVYDSRWVSQDLVKISQYWGSDYQWRDPVATCYVEQDGETSIIYPLRSGSPVAVASEGDTVAFTYVLGPHPKSAANPSVITDKDGSAAPNLSRLVWQTFGERTLAPTGQTFAAIAPGLEPLEPSDSDEETQVAAWHRIVTALASHPRLREAVFCRLVVTSSHAIRAVGSGSTKRSLIEAGAGDEILVRVQYRVPHLDDIDQRGGPPPVLRAEVTNTEVVKNVGPEEFALSKYGEVELHFRCEIPYKASETDILVWRKDNPTLGPYFKIPIRVTATKAVAANTLSSVLTAAIGAAGAVSAAGTLKALTEAPVTKGWNALASLAPQPAVSDATSSLVGSPLGNPSYGLLPLASDLVWTITGSFQQEPSGHASGSADFLSGYLWAFYLATCLFAIARVAVQHWLGSVSIRT